MNMEIVPDTRLKKKNQKVWGPLRTTIASIMSGSTLLQEASPGGKHSGQAIITLVVFTVDS